MVDCKQGPEFLSLSVSKKLASPRSNEENHENNIKN
jgi:hypothetical protein